jgi:hypothetical protein
MPSGNFQQRQKELLLLLRNGVNQQSDNSQVHIERFEFSSVITDRDGNDGNFFLQQDSEIQENLRFTYDVFVPNQRKDHQSAILLLHGLNERSWNKYLQWADYLAGNTMKPVILFPIAFHMNRSPSLWTNPRIMKFWMERRKRSFGIIKALSFANVALSNRLSDEPYRFYYAGRQTINDLVSLAGQIRDGQHPLFGKGAKLDIFGYSIGSFLAEILLMANPENLFASSRLFVFCGGSIFRQMYGTSRYIMDEKAYERLLSYYCNEWFTPPKNASAKNIAAADNLKRAFNAMISPDIYQDERESFFRSWRNRIAGISLQKDRVMPYSGVEACMGHQTAKACFEVMDFPFDYTHETPFPLNDRMNVHALEISFLKVFRKCAAFLA